MCPEPERRKRLLAVAERVFTTHGYTAATMEEVARRAAMSKRTVYGLYPDKRRLLAAVVVAADDFPWEEEEAAALTDPLAELRRRLLAVTRFVLSPRQVRLTRLLVAEARRAPKLAEDFHERVMVRGVRYIATAVERLRQRGAVPVATDTASTADALLGAAIGPLHMLALFGKARLATREYIETQVETALRMGGYARVAGRRTSALTDGRLDPENVA